MTVAIIGSILHIGWSYLFVKFLNYGAVGAGLASSITNLIILIGNLVVSRMQDGMKEALKVSFFD
jgi:Na+-driven multidrug efflux pump